jgi:lipopolysaccharide/colanic/teichoic acid biosynthesis glycosyltransferase
VVQLPTRQDPVGWTLTEAPAWRLALKRGMDLMISIASIVLLAPVLLACALAVKITSPGPVFYTSWRVGKNGEVFRFRKFRSMRLTAEDEKSSLVDLNEQTGPVFKIREDPRVTSVGRWLRRTSLDELPQLLHVASGRMSLVGPRPHLPEEVAHYGSRAFQRLSVKPGVTCIWQVSGRSDLDFDTWIDLDLEYIEGWSLWNDVKLLVLTVPAVLSGRGAY